MRITSRKRTAFGATALAAAALLTACTSGTPAEAPSKRASDATIDSFTYAFTQWPKSLDGRTTQISTAQISTLVTQPLERFAYEGGAVRFKPNLAVSIRQPDSRTAVYTLRGGVKFSDGTPLTAEDVAWSIAEAATPVAETSADMQGFGSAIATGTNEVTVKWQYAIPPTSLREKIASTVEVQQAEFGRAHAKDLGTPAALPIGTGPYTYQSQTAQNITLVPNPAYWGTRPKVQRLIFTRFTEDSSAQLALRSGSVQGSQVIDPKTAPLWQRISGASLYIAHDPSISFISLDLNTPPFDDVHVRKAIAHSIDRKSIIQAAFGGHADLLHGILPADGISDAAPSLEAAQKFLDRLPSNDFDLTKAKAELAQSDHPQGFTTTMTYSSGSAWQQILLLSLQENMKSLGVTINLKPISPQEWFQNFFSHRATGMQVFPGVAVLNGDVSAILPGMVGKASMRPNLLNNANFTTPEVESAYPMLAPRSIGKYSKAEQWKATQTVLSEIAAQVPYVPLFSPNTLHALGSGYMYTRTPSHFDMLSGSWIDYLRASK
ncbi:ABC transporter substrate-binding protein [Streptomyces sp. NPDC001840]